MRAAAATLLVLLVFPLSAKVRPSSTTPFVGSFDRGIAVQAWLNGRGPFSLVLDTGSSHSAISEQVARVVGAVLVARTTVVTPIGEETRPVARVDRIDLGGEESSGVLVSVLTHSIGHVDGVIGQDILARRRYTIDVRRRRIEWLPAADDANDSTRSSTVQLTFDEGRAVALIPQRESALRLVPDTGAEGLVLFRHAERLIPGMVTTRAVRTFTTLTASGHARHVLLPELRLGSSTYHQLPAVVVDAAAGEWCDGLLPVRMFERVTFDGPRNQLTLVTTAR